MDLDNLAILQQANNTRFSFFFFFLNHVTGLRLPAQDFTGALEAGLMAISGP